MELVSAAGTFVKTCHAMFEYDETFLPLAQTAGFAYVGIRHWQGQGRAILNHMENHQSVNSLFTFIFKPRVASLNKSFEL